MKIGKIVTLDKDVELTTFGGVSLKAKKGDKGFVTEDGSVKLITGKAMNKIITTDIKPDGIDCRSIAELIFRELNIGLDLGKILQEYDLEDEHCIGAVESVLEDIF